MPIRGPGDVPAAEITPRAVTLDRRRLLAGLGLLALGKPAFAGARLAAVKSPLSTDEKPTPFRDVTHYNNFYEFGTKKEEPAELAKDFRTSPWTVTVGGAVARPRTFDLDALLKLAPLEERIYRHRCVEGWSIVVPWIGYSLAALLKKVEPAPKARYVAFRSFYDPAQMPEAKWAGIPWPYVEGLRMDEAMHPLTILAVGLYGEVIPNQDGAPVRLVVPWKYGFKSIKSIVKITLVEEQPPTAWSLESPREYGFYSNVNPDVDHPRWSQATERRLGEFGKRKTLPFNGYAAQVAHLYQGMDLKKFF